MAATISLTANNRTVTGKQVGALRRAGKLPAVLYGPETDPLPIQLDQRDASRTLSRLTGTHLIDLTVDGAMHKTLVREIQRDSIRGTLMHVDFYKVAMDRTIRITVPINLVGTAPATTTDGVLVHGITEIDVECLPGDILSGLDVDLSGLKAVGDTIHLRDVDIPKTIKVLSDPDELIARITHQAAEEVVPVEPLAVAPEVEVIEKGKKEEEEGEEEKK
ncbi:MAG: 50S ribosomal protein L25 [Chloroflexi bacterium]|nr:50S ribosomal protein L25 [Chloroflexota bacterium]